MSDGSTGRILGTIVGAVAGYFTGGASYVALGATLGGAAGSLLDPKAKTETNRLDDIKVSISKYGDGIPETWGNNVPPATWIWSTYVIQIPQKQSGGKGGGTENTNYLQFIYGTLCFGRSPPPGVPVTLRKLWIDGKLNYDGSTGLSVGQALANEENPFQQLILRDGNADQLPWALTEQWEGIGNVPARRGQITGEIFGLQVPGGRVPQIQVEICIGADTVQQWQTVGELDPGISDIPVGVIKQGQAWHTVLSRPFEADVFRSFYIDHGAVTFSGEARAPHSTYTGLPIPVVGSDPAKVLMLRGGGTNTMTVDSFDMEDAVISAGVASIASSGVISVGGKQGAAYDITNRTFVLLNNTGTFGGQPYVYTENGSGDFRGALVGECCPIAIYSQLIRAVVIKTIGSDRKLYLDTIDAVTGALIDSVEAPIAAVTLTNIIHQSRVHADDSGVYCYLHHGTLPSMIAKYADGAWTVLSANASCPSGSWATDNAQTFFSNNAGATVGPTQDEGRYYHLRYNVVSPASASVAGIIASQSSRSGLAPTQFDVADIDDTVWGLTFKSPASARSNIAPLLTYAAIGVVEEDGLLRYFHRADKSSIDTVPYEELGSVEDGSEPGEPFALVRANAQEFPRSVTVTYNDPNFDYQQSTVKAMRYAVDSINDEQQVLDVAMDGSRAASIAHRLLYERWLAQNTRSFKVSRRYAYWSAGDVVTFLKKDGTSYGAFMLSKLTDTGALIEGECFPADGDLAVQTVPGPGIYKAQAIEALPSIQRVEIVDGPIWQDADNNAGVYVAMEPYSGAPGAELFVGDDDNSLQSRGIVQNASVIGVTESALGAWTSGVMDETNSIVINIGEGNLNSITRSVLDTTTANTAAIGQNGRWEYVQFLRAGDLGGGRFLLSGLARGMRGTQRNRGNHASGDKFVLLGEAGVLRPGMDVGAIGSTKYYRAISKGRSFNSAASKPYANTGEGLKPFSPWDARWTKAPTNDITLTWQRRTRMSSNALRGVVPLGETAEAYVVELYTSGSLTTLAGSFTSSTNSLTVTSAQQAAIGLTPGATPFRRIYQISESVGRGAPLEAIV